jgi:hypothetical protein
MLLITLKLFKGKVELQLKFYNNGTILSLLIICLLALEEVGLPQELDLT